MENFSDEEFANGINRCLDDGDSDLINCGVIRAYGHSNWHEIIKCLKKWETDGILLILNDPERCLPTVPCVKMLKFIHRRSSRPGFLNYDE
jgi:hypothetical protein